MNKKASAPLVLPAMMVLTSIAAAQAFGPRPTYVQLEPSYRNGCASLAVSWDVFRPHKVQESSVSIVGVTGVESGPYVVTPGGGTPRYTAHFSYSGNCPKDYFPLSGVSWPLDFYVEVVSQSGSQESSHVRIPETIIASIVSHPPQPTQIETYGYGPYLFVSFKTPREAITRVEANCDQSGRHNSDVTAGKNHLHVLRDVQADETCDTSVVFIDIDGNDVGPAQGLGRTTIKPLQNYGVSATVTENRFNSTEFRLGPRNLAALTYEVLDSASKPLISEKGRDDPNSNEFVLDTKSFAKGQTYTVVFRGYLVPRHVVEFATARGLNTKGTYFVEVSRDFTVPGLPKPSEPLTITLGANTVTVSTATPEDSVLGVKYATGQIIQTSKPGPKPSVPLAVASAIREGLTLTLSDAKDADRTIQTEVRVLIDVPKDSRIARMSKDVTKPAPSGREPTSNERLTWTDIAKSGLATVIKFLPALL